MPTIKLAQPSAGEHAVVPSEPFARIVLDFPAEHAAMEHPEGSDSLLFRFADGSAVELQDFYAQYGRDRMPEFEVNGAVMKGASREELKKMYMHKCVNVLGSAGHALD